MSELVSAGTGMSLGYGSYAIPILAAISGAALVVFVVMLSRVQEPQRLLAALLAAAAIVAAVWLGSDAIDGMTMSQRFARRQALDQRRAELIDRAADPNSVLACLSGLAGTKVEAACKAVVFASAHSTALAVADANARLQLLADSFAYARRFDAGYAAKVAGLRRAVEHDAYGLYAHVLAVRDGCTSEHCPAFSWLHNTAMLRTHLREQLYAHQVAQFSPGWPQAGPAHGPTTAALPSVPQQPPAAAAGSAGPAVAAVSKPELKAVHRSAAAGKPVTAAVPLPIAAPASLRAKTQDRVVAERHPSKPTHRESTGDARARINGDVPPVASVLPNLDFPSADSIPAISIMRPEPPLPSSAHDNAKK